MAEQQCVSDNQSRNCATVEPLVFSEVLSCTAASGESMALSNKLSQVSMSVPTERAVWCTVCVEEFRKLDEIKLHPNLDVMMCATCLNALEERRTSMDHGKKSVKMVGRCYWCGSREEFNECSCCDLEWCSKCILRNIGDESLEEVDEDYCWTCFVCSPEVLHGVKDELDFFMDVAAQNGHETNCNHGILLKCPSVQRGGF